MALTAQEEQELASIENELGTRQAKQTSGLTQEEEFELAQIEQELSTRGSQEASVNPNREADLGFVNRSRYAIEPLESNRKALLIQEFGEENVKQDADGNMYINQNGQFRPVNKEGLSFADVADFAGATPEMAGGVVGTVAGGVGASVPGAIALGAAGGALGSAVRQGASALLGTPQVANVGERIAETGLSAGIGGLFGGAGKGIQMASPAIKRSAGAAADVFTRTAKKVPGVQTVSDAIDTSSKATKGVIESINKTFSFKRADDADELFRIADKIGVDKELLPEAIEFGDKSMISRTSRVIAEGPLGEEKLLKFQKAHNQVSNALDNSISRISPSGSTMTRDEAGQFIIDSVNDASKEFFGSLDETYSNLVENAPGLKLSKNSQDSITSKLNGLRTFAIGRAERGIGSQKQEAKSIIQAVESLKKSNGSLKQTVEALKNIGEEAFKKGNQNRLPIDQKRLQSLYFDVQKEAIQAIREHYGDDVADNLIRNNKMISDFIGENSVLSKSIGKDMAPEKVFQSLIENGDTRKAEAIMAVLPPEKMQSLKSSFLYTMVKRNTDGDVLFDSTIKNLDKKKELVSKLFSPEELDEIKEVLILGKRMGNPVMSTSGTGASNSFNNFLNEAKGAVFNETSLEMAKKRGRNTTEKFVRKTRPQGKKYIPSDPGKNGSYGNLLFDSAQRDGAYFTRGPAADSSTTRNSRDRPLKSKDN